MNDDYQSEGNQPDSDGDSVKPLDDIAIRFKCVDSGTGLPIGSYAFTRGGQMKQITAPKDTEQISRTLLYDSERDDPWTAENITDLC